MFHWLTKGEARDNHLTQRAERDAVAALVGALGEPAYDGILASQRI
jgi:hypothetical protein